MGVPNKTGTDGSFVVPLTQRWNRVAAPEQGKKALTLSRPLLGNIDSIPIYPTMETAALGNPTSQRPTVIDPMDFMRGNPYE